MNESSGGMRESFALLAVATGGGAGGGAGVADVPRTRVCLHGAASERELQRRLFATLKMPCFLHVLDRQHRVLYVECASRGTDCTADFRTGSRLTRRTPRHTPR
jgi:hypothetical protein